MGAEKLLKYYQDEMEYLVEGGKDFSIQHPELAKYLNFSSFSSNDPDIQRLIESVAFLNARLQKRLDDQAPVIASELLKTIYPQFSAPIPSMTIMRFSNNSATTSKIIKKNTQLSSKSKYEYQNYIFKTTRDVNIEPCEVTDIQIIKSANALIPRDVYNICNNVLLIDLQLLGGVKELTFYIHMPELSAHAVYEALMSVYPDKNTPIFEDGKKIGEVQAVGFDDESNLFPVMQNENSGYKFLIEYNVFPQKFMFFKLNFSTQPKKQLQIPFNIHKEIYIKKDDLLLNCVPAVNLFEKLSEPIMIDNKSSEYRIIADSNSLKNINIHSMISLHPVESREDLEYAQYYSCQHFLNPRKRYVFWQMKKDEIAMNDNYLVLYNPLFTNNVVYSRMLCYNKNCSRFVESDENWDINGEAAGVNCVNLDKPTEALSGLENSQTQWRLISHLAINHFGFENTEALRYVQELLSIYNFTDSNNGLGLKDLAYKTNMVSNEGAIVPQTQIVIKVDDNVQNFVLARVLGAFFAKMLNFNTKMQLILEKEGRNRVWKKWQIV